MNNPTSGQALPRPDTNIDLAKVKARNNEIRYIHKKALEFLPNYRSTAAAKEKSWVLEALRDEYASYIALYDANDNICGLWVREPDNPGLTEALVLFSNDMSAPAVLEAVLRLRRVENHQADIGGGVVITGGAFLMLGDAKAPSEPDPAYYFARLWIDCL